jgi:hypothetical protein
VAASSCEQARAKGSLDNRAGIDTVDLAMRVGTHNQGLLPLSGSSNKVVIGRRRVPQIFSNVATDGEPGRLRWEMALAEIPASSAKACTESLLILAELTDTKGYLLHCIINVHNNERL